MYTKVFTVHILILSSAIRINLQNPTWAASENSLKCLFNWKMNPSCQYLHQSDPATSPQNIHKRNYTQLTFVLLGVPKTTWGSEICHLKLQLKSSNIVYIYVTNNNWDIEMCSQWKLFGTISTNWFLELCTNKAAKVTFYQCITIQQYGKKNLKQEQANV